MGWNEGYEIYENTVVAVYDAGHLDLALLDRLMIPFIETGPDSGGSRELLAYDGLTADEIVIKVVEPETFELLRTDIAKNTDQRYKLVSDAWFRIVRIRWKMWT